jgi:hypothetical protein
MEEESDNESPIKKNLLSSARDDTDAVISYIDFNK